jgi:hypothetical protein
MSTNSTTTECLERMLLGSPANKLRDMQKKIRTKSTAIFLLNFERSEIFGVFKAGGLPALNIEPDAWKFSAKGKNFPAQVRVARVGGCSGAANFTKKDREALGIRGGACDEHKTEAILRKLFGGTFTEHARSELMMAMQQEPANEITETTTWAEPCIDASRQEWSSTSRQEWGASQGWGGASHQVWDEASQQVGDVTAAIRPLPKSMRYNKRPIQICMHDHCPVGAKCSFAHSEAERKAWESARVGSRLEKGSALQNTKAVTSKTAAKSGAKTTTRATPPSPPSPPSGPALGSWALRLKTNVKDPETMELEALSKALTASESMHKVQETRGLAAEPVGLGVGEDEQLRRALEESAKTAAEEERKRKRDEEKLRRKEMAIAQQAKLREEMQISQQARLRGEMEMAIVQQENEGMTTGISGDQQRYNLRPGLEFRIAPTPLDMSTSSTGSISTHPASTPPAPIAVLVPLGPLGCVMSLQDPQLQLSTAGVVEQVGGIIVTEIGEVSRGHPSTLMGKVPIGSMLLSIENVDVTGSEWTLDKVQVQLQLAAEESLVKLPASIRGFRQLYFLPPASQPLPNAFELPAGIGAQDSQTSNPSSKPSSPYSNSADYGRLAGMAAAAAAASTFDSAGFGCTYNSASPPKSLQQLLAEKRQLAIETHQAVVAMQQTQRINEQSPSRQWRSPYGSEYDRSDLASRSDFASTFGASADLPLAIPSSPAYTPHSTTSRPDTYNQDTLAEWLSVPDHMPPGAKKEPLYPSYNTPSHSTPSHNTPSYSTPSHNTPSHSTPSYDASSASSRIMEIQQWLHQQQLHGPMDQTSPSNGQTGPF